MIDQVETNLYKLELPLPENPLRSINCYLIKGPERFLLIDTGMNREECLKEIDGDLKRLSVDLNNTDFFITHLHADHIGLISKLAAGNSRIYFNRIEAGRVKGEDFWKVVQPASLANGFPEHEIKHFLEEHPSRRYGPQADIVFSLCSDGGNITVGDYSLSCTETPGHSPGHMCLYDANKKILFSGDHLLGDITPNISALGILNDEDPLRDYFKSLERIYALDVDMVLPGHGGLFNDHRQRVREIKKHHQMRLDEVVSILKDRRSLTPYETASRMTWDINGKWPDFPVTQKWFATGEALSHLIFLRNKGVVNKKMLGGVWHYLRKSSRHDKSEAEQAGI
ncbi:MAG: MBL fold metallo-hydrolase [Deltaproteobacteria bacterium]|nr:MBL fold metallo-hydrolase [Deltaproteobacteria bacterium]MBW2358593.1 MBL fold metallo-hydrolase [Deltaproteobacteria bacterium]